MTPHRHAGDDADELDAALDDLARAPADQRHLTRLAGALARSARAAGAQAVASGRWLAGVVIDLTPRIPVRDRATLEAEHGLSGPALADELVLRASRGSAAVGAASGALIAAEELAPPAWVLVPLHLVVETLAVAVIELRLLAELHEAYGRPIPGTPNHRSMALLQAWAERRGVTPATMARSGGLADTLGRGARRELVRLVRRRVMARLGRNLSTAAPLLAGAAVGAQVNRRATLALATAVRRDLEAPDRGAGTTAGTTGSH